ncbi:hypothetical protein GCM10023194_38380 [Planotetraspora phitsanulokensis]|uniref:Spore-associated protein A n=1 Tax=Planotetraspora phitsanulokensis TaxID=575192 RepID=A0A8J3U9F5_9ACTN|nr:hypothetical protein [Planotetraspora phitsanulokensis]GII41199.1 hypothetical protein Pph01_62020 [Planotetraspora phitsanulokensis]
MNKLVKTLAVAGAAACALAVSAPAQAASNPYNHESVCGSGYYNIDHHDLYTSSGIKVATIWLDYNGSSNCVTTFEYSTLAEVFLKATLQVEGSTTKVDSGDFKYYAGPVRAVAPGKCVKWGGQWDVDPGVSWTSQWSHCG